MNKTIKQTTVDKYYYKDYDSLQKHLKLFLKAYNNAKHLRSLQGNTPFGVLCFFTISISSFIGFIFWICLRGITASHKHLDSYHYTQ